MVITEYYRTREDGVVLVRSYSDKGVYIHGGYPEGDYAEVIDPQDANRTYVETDIPIEETEATAEDALNILLGRTP